MWRLPHTSWSFGESETLRRSERWLTIHSWGLWSARTPRTTWSPWSRSGWFGPSPTPRWTDGGLYLMLSAYWTHTYTHRGNKRKSLKRLLKIYFHFLIIYSHFFDCFILVSFLSYKHTVDTRRLTRWRTRSSRGWGRSGWSWSSVWSHSLGRGWAWV